MNSPQGQARTLAALWSFDWSGLTRGLCLGGLFCVGTALFVGGVVVGVSATGPLGLSMRIAAGGAGACLAGVAALVMMARPGLGARAAVPLAIVVFLGSLNYAAIRLERDLAIVTYRDRSWEELRMEEIAAGSPSAPEQTDYRLYYTLRSRIGGSDLFVDATLPLGDWRLTYAADLASVSRVRARALPAAPPVERIALWQSSGGLELPMLVGGTLVAPPEIASRRRDEGGRFAIVRTAEDGVFALIEFPDGTSP